MPADEPAEQAAYAAMGELVCDASQVMWTGPRSDASRCEGPWEYDQYAVREMEHEDCGVHSCIEEKRCTAWPRRTATYDTTLTPPLVCDGRDGAPSALPPRCYPDYLQAQDECDAFAQSQQQALNREPGQRRAQVLHAQLHGTASPQAVRCTVALAYERREEQVCGCHRWRYHPCAHADPALPPVTVRTEPGRTLAEVRAAHASDQVPGQAAVDGLRLVCTTAEEPGLAPQQRFARLHESMQDPSIVDEGTPLHARVVERLMLVYELFGASLTPEQRAVARAIYGSNPVVEPACGRHVPPEMPRCDPQVDAALRLCTRLGSTHVAPALVEADYDACLALLTELGDALAAGTCQGDASYVAASVAAHRRLHERMLAGFGDVLMAVERASGTEVPTYDLPAIARMLHVIDRWHEATRAVLADPARRQAELAVVINTFWQVAQGHRPHGAAGPMWSRGSLYDHVAQALARADALEAAGNEAGARQAVADALEVTERHALALDQAILLAAYGQVEGTARPVLTGAPLVQITADALAPLADRLEALTQYHDLGCALARCATFAAPTRLSRLWKVLAHLDDGSEAPVSLGQVLAATPGDLSGWRPVFRAIHAHQERLLGALAEATASMLAHGPALHDLIERAEARAATYARTGMFQPALGQTLQTGVHSAQRQRVLDHIDQQRLFLEGAHADLERRLVSLVHGLARVGDAQATRARLEAARARGRIELDALARREASYRRLIADGTAPDATARPIDGADALFEAIMAAWARAEGASDGAAYLRLGDTQVLRLTGADARFAGWETQTVPQLAVGMRPVAAGQVVSIATEPGTVWAPTCALRQVRLVDPEEAWEGASAGLALDPTGALTGPEGYTLTWTGSTYRAASRHEGTSTRVSTGANLRACVGSPGVRLIGSGAETCAYTDVSHSRERGQSWQNGTEGRTSAQFASGLYLPTTPFEAPVGSLVVVEMPPGESDPARLRNVHLVRAPHTTLALDEAADLYFVVNDVACAEQDRAHVLEVTVGTFVPLDRAAEALVHRMAHTMALVRAHAPAVIARGGLLPTERSLLEHDALLAQLGGPGERQIPVEAYPTPLKNLFYHFLAREMVRLEAMAELAKVEAELRIQEAEHRALAVDLHQATLSGYLLGLVPRWTVRGMRLAEMHEVTTDFTRDIRHFVVPLLDLWYPEVAASLPELAVLQRLAHVDVNTPVLDLVGELAELGRALHRRLAEARLPYPSEDDTARTFVILRFPQPARMAPTCAGVPGARCPLAAESETFRWATVTEAQALWEILTAPLTPGATHRRLTFHVKPEDLYEPYAGTSYLSCRQALPVVRRLGLLLPGFARERIPGEARFVEGQVPAPARLGFVTTEGLWSFELGSPVWRTLNRIPVVFAEDDYLAAEQRFLAIAQDVRGISPFTTIELVLPEAIVEAWQMRAASSIDLVMELESIRTGAPVAVPVCALAEERRLAHAAALEAAEPMEMHFESPEGAR